ncbi:DNA topoisomerase IB [Variovorax dokdonensis]|uniref:DNA topoisomerase n=1 Tax=Variovorax dokdonensis TaxID=344883 RepID=A0ABT7N973_9BURK|nr:DNA topoisomerase IB [Variovorax dokdonensis]MDM0044469.1 DNA topoisomerase IB [Variovorax dokdonensis]
MSGMPPPLPQGKTLRETLRRVSDDEPGLRRARRGRRFVYLDPRGRTIRSESVLARIRALAIPPAYADVWVCASADGHIQATGRDARGRKQYRYHPLWQAERSRHKFDALIEFGHLLPRLRRKVQHILCTGEEPTRERVTAALVRLIDSTGMRIGNIAYARDNGSYGVSTLRCSHARITDSSIHFDFVGKSGVRHVLEVKDACLARLVRRCAALPGHALFQYLCEPEGRRRRINANDINDWLCTQAGGPDITAKVFRTWRASVLALELLLDNKGPARRDVVRAVAAQMGNTPAVCRKSYIAPAVMALIEARVDKAELQAEPWAAQPPQCRGLRLAERQLLGLLECKAGNSKSAAH